MAKVTKLLGIAHLRAHPGPLAWLAVICSVAAVGAFATSQFDDPGRGERVGSAFGTPTFPLPGVSLAIELATGYLERNCDSDGRFAYMSEMASGRQSPSYNIIRHAGAMYALAMLNRSHPDNKAIKAEINSAVRATEGFQGGGSGFRV